MICWNIFTPPALFVFGYENNDFEKIITVHLLLHCVHMYQHQEVVLQNVTDLFCFLTRWCSRLLKHKKSLMNNKKVWKHLDASSLPVNEW